MQNQYINELIGKIQDTQFYCTDAEIEFNDYDRGIAYLVDVFTKHKKAGSQLFFIGNSNNFINIFGHLSVTYLNKK